MRRGLYLFIAVVVAAHLSSFTFAAAEGPAKHKLLALDGQFVKWGLPKLGSGAVVRYALAQRNYTSPTARNCRDIGPADRIVLSSKIAIAQLRSELTAAFSAWKMAADITFEETSDALAADILIGAQSQSHGRAFANVAPRARRDRRGNSSPTGGGKSPIQASIGASDGQVEWTKSVAVASIDKSLICLNPKQRWKIGFDGDLDTYDLRYTFMHEIGHAIGLDHPGSRDEVMGFKYSETFRTLRAGDVIGAVRLYGARKTGSEIKRPGM